MLLDIDFLCDSGQVQSTLVPLFRVEMLSTSFKIGSMRLITKLISPKNCLETFIARQ
jgi:hypothetical protein